MLEVSFSSLCKVSKISSKAFNLLKIVFVVAFVFKMSFFQMESLKVMEKFDGGNFHLCKFKMSMIHHLPPLPSISPLKV